MEALTLMILILILIQVFVIVHFLLELRKDFTEFKDQYNKTQK